MNHRLSMLSSTGLLSTVLVSAVLVLGGCASSSKVMLGQARTPIDPSQVQIYPNVPPGATQIAQLEATSGVGFGTQGQTDAAIARMKREAAALGANGVVLMGVGTSGSPGGMSVGGGSYGSHGYGGVGFGIPTSQKSAAGVAIYVPANMMKAPEPIPMPAPEPDPVK